MDDNPPENRALNYSGVNIRELIDINELRNPMAVRSVNSGDKDDKDIDDNEEFDATAAFLGPNLWDNKTLSDFKLEYLDLDEFLQDNGIADSETLNRFKNTFNNKPINTVDEKLNHGAQHGGIPQHKLEPDNCDKRDESSIKKVSESLLETDNNSDFGRSSCLGSPGSISSASNESLSHDTRMKTSKDTSSSSLQNKCDSKMGVDLELDYKISPNELALACVPGQNFDPTNHSFSEDELKPQPMIKKSKKQFVPEEFKDDKYWARRRKNNMAAKRSREARRVKENQIVLRASYLEKENNALKEEVAKLRHDNMMLKKKIRKYENQS